ncbi:MAG: Cro/C1-type DNA-binding domain [Burkholderiales bacterium]|jgi:DNA-binding XRE family transcriptional regulator|nr:Cro/C1-type DNA-binding domain [Burkholderiales bacterium]
MIKYVNRKNYLFFGGVCMINNTKVDVKVSKTPNSNLTSNLQYLMKKTRITSVDLAESVKVSAELIGKLKNGWLSNPSLKVLAGIARHFNLSLQELVFADLKNVGNHMAEKPISYIPIVDWSKIKFWKDEPPLDSIALENISRDNLFALHLAHDYGEFKKGSYIFINTEQKPKNNDYVLVLNKDSDSFNLKKLIIEDFYYLQGIITDIGGVVKYNEQDYQIYGVIIGCQSTKFF